MKYKLKQLFVSIDTEIVLVYYNNRGAGTLLKRTVFRSARQKGALQYPKRVDQGTVGHEALRVEREEEAGVVVRRIGREEKEWYRRQCHGVKCRVRRLRKNRMSVGRRRGAGTGARREHIVTNRLTVEPTENGGYVAPVRHIIILTGK